MRIAYVDTTPGGEEIHVADYTESGVIRGGDLIEIGGITWEIQDVLLCEGSSVISAILGQPVDAVARVRPYAALAQVQIPDACGDCGHSEPSHVWGRCIGNRNLCTCGGWVPPELAITV